MAYSRFFWPSRRVLRKSSSWDSGLLARVRPQTRSERGLNDAEFTTVLGMPRACPLMREVARFFSWPEYCQRRRFRLSDRLAKNRHLARCHCLGRGGRVLGGGALSVLCEILYRAQLLDLVWRAREAYLRTCI